MKLRKKFATAVGLTAAAVTIGVISTSGAAYASTYGGWFRYKSQCDEIGHLGVNSGVYVRYTCVPDSPGYQLYLYK